jgi:hypothetical protein
VIGGEMAGASISVKQENQIVPRTSAKGINNFQFSFFSHRFVFIFVLHLFSCGILPRDVFLFFFTYLSAMFF